MLRSFLVLNSDAFISRGIVWGGQVHGAAVRFRSRSPILHAIATALVSALSVYTVSKLLNPLLFYAEENAICWPMDGLLIGVLLLCSRKDWPWIMTGYALATLPETLSQGWSAFGVFLDLACNVFEMVFAASMLPHFTNLSDWLRTPRLILRFSVVVLIGATLIPAIPFVAFAHFYLGWEFWLTLKKWVSGDALGISLYTPLVLVLASRETYALLRPGQRTQTLSMFGVLVGSSWLVFHQTAFPVAFLLFAILVVVVDRIGFPGAVLAVNLMTVFAANGTIRGAGPFMFIQGVHEPYRILTLQVYLTIAMVMCFAITLTARERDDFQEQLKLALQQMEVLATLDGLTGLGNRRLFDQTLDAEWGRARRQGRPLGLLMLDADRFKVYNDTYGHPAGDQCLCAIAGSLGPLLKRAGDMAARYGGEEFVVLLPGATLADASAVAESIRESVEALGIEHKGNAGQVVTVSVGCSAMIPEGDLPPKTLVAAADAALYAAKQGGRNRVVCSDSIALVNCEA